MTQRAANPVDDAINYCKYQAQKGLPSLISLMQRTAADWQRCLTAMKPEQAAFAPEGEWTALQVAGHFVGVTAGVNKQIVQLTGGNLPGAIDEDALEAAGGQRTFDSVHDASDAMAVLFDEVVSLTDSLEGNLHLEARFPHPLFGQLNILEWIAFQRLHAQDHMQQISKNQAAPGYPEG